MSLLLFKYGLPVLLGYTLFAGISGALNPFRRPDSYYRRPAWILGLWSGLTVSLVLAASLHLAFQLPAGTAHTLLKPSASLLAALLIPAFIFYFSYGRSLQKQLNSQFDEDVEDESNDLDTDVVGWEGAPDNITPAYLLNAEVQEISLDNQKEAVNDARQNVVTEHIDQKRGQDFTPAPEETQATEITRETEHAQTQEFTREPEQSGALELTEIFAQSQKHRQDLQPSLTSEQQQLQDPAASQNLDKEIEKIFSSRFAPGRGNNPMLPSDTNTIKQLEKDLRRERRRRKQSERQLAITKQSLAFARHQLKRSNAARAEALSTANKSIAFARQTVQIRARLETELDLVQKSLKKRQSTISNLITAMRRGMYEPGQNQQNPTVDGENLDHETHTEADQSANADFNTELDQGKAG